MMFRKTSWLRSVIDSDANGDDLPEYKGFDAELECMMACVEELARLQGRKGPDARNRALKYLIERFDGEDRQEAIKVIGNVKA